MIRDQILEAIERASTIIVVGHMRPDGDCLGSAFALREYCIKHGKKADVGSPTPAPESYSFIRNISAFNRFTQKRYDLFIAVDCGAKDRIGRLEGYFNAARETVCIDHHQNHGGFAKYNYVVPDASSTCELVYDILDPTGEIDANIANYLFMGLSTDTGHFMHSNTTPKVLYTAYKLAKYGADIYRLSTLLYRSRTREKTELIAEAIRSMRFYENGKVAFITMTREMLDRCHIDANETEGIIDYAIAVKGVEIGISICEEKPNEFKVSFRSRGRRVDAIASVFGGGGHIFAAGCRVSGVKEDVVDKIMKAVRDTSEQ